MVVTANSSLCANLASSLLSSKCLTTAKNSADLVRDTEEIPERSYLKGSSKARLLKEEVLTFFSISALISCTLLGAVSKRG